MQKLKLSKLHVCGNHFILIEAKEQNEHDWAKLSVTLCKHKFGIGADGLLVVFWDERKPNEFAFRMFNPDGTEDGCGNGLLCAGRFLYEQILSKYGFQQKSFTAKTIWGKRTVQIISDDPKEFLVEAEIGVPVWHPKKIPLNVAMMPKQTKLASPIELVLNHYGIKVRCIAVNTGSTHAVVFWDEELEDELWTRLSTAIENHPLFPMRTSIMWAKVISKDKVRVRSFERGVGETLSCGTGACAVVAVGIATGKLGRSVSVSFKGGQMYVRLDEQGKLYLKGQVEHVFDAVTSLPLKRSP